jgi:hypothetical protein
MSMDRAETPTDPAPSSPLSVLASYLAGRFDALRLADRVGPPPSPDGGELAGYLAGYRGRPCAG